MAVGGSTREPGGRVLIVVQSLVHKGVDPPMIRPQEQEAAGGAHSHRRQIIKKRPRRPDIIYFPIMWLKLKSSSCMRRVTSPQPTAPFPVLFSNHGDAVRSVELALGCRY